MFDFFTWDFWQPHGLWLMFVSAFLSATVLPGNSELVFLALMSPLALKDNFSFSGDMLALLTTAVIGNSLGSLTTYWLGRWFPEANLRKHTHPRTRWAIEKMQHYGVIILFFSWVPIVGDLFCAIAGWLRLNGVLAMLFITLGKLVRYVFLMFFGWATLF
ncbi:DedA family protein [[Pasteurella] aerogenes]|nr:DedA family protein [[Pasteurella] aerogenes]MCU9999164.1 DedA family protein [[Pasteurella] aerogenes]MDY4593498.1 YqaA family protein [[Pasteurella] aerogenes]VEG69601.1 inner membrane protein YqaA [[Pasteurella] aerogenes]